MWGGGRTRRRGLRGGNHFSQRIVSSWPGKDSFLSPNLFGRLVPSPHQALPESCADTSLLRVWAGLLQRGLRTDLGKNPLIKPKTSAPQSLRIAGGGTNGAGPPRPRPAQRRGPPPAEGGAIAGCLCRRRREAAAVLRPRTFFPAAIMSTPARRRLMRDFKRWAGTPPHSTGGERAARPGGRGRLGSGGRLRGLTRPLAWTGLGVAPPGCPGEGRAPVPRASGTAGSRSGRRVPGRPSGPAPLCRGRQLARSPRVLPRWGRRGRGALRAGGFARSHPHHPRGALRGRAGGSRRAGPALFVPPASAVRRRLGASEDKSWSRLFKTRAAPGRARVGGGSPGGSWGGEVGVSRAGGGLSGWDVSPLPSKGPAVPTWMFCRTSRTPSSSHKLWNTESVWPRFMNRPGRI